MEIPYQIFGSESSIDLDVCFFVDDLGTIQENHETIKVNIEKLAFNSDKKVNANLAVVQNGTIESSFKGDEDELNNALFETYHLHAQKFERRICRKVKRNLDARIERCLRSLVSYFTRTLYRVEAKTALRGNTGDKIMFLDSVQLKRVEDFGKNGSVTEVYKSIAFQLGITLALLESVELYTKESILDYYPDLKNYLAREKEDSEVLQVYIIKFIELMKKRNYETEFRKDK